LLLSAAAVGGWQAKPDPWAPIRFLVGDWEGRADGQAGTGTARRTYSFVLKDRYLYEKNVDLPPSENPAGEVPNTELDGFDRAQDPGLTVPP
jgi:hypothetical protein